jgi:hypothetical protein
MPRKNYNEELQEIKESYRRANQAWPATAYEIVEWGLRQGLLVPEESRVIGLYAEDMAKALREEYHTDPQGRQVRTMHSARIRRDNGQTAFVWDSMISANRDYMEKALQ